MNGKPPNPRVADWDIDSQFLDRWSPRAFSDEPLSEREIHTLFEAARWAPSCYNEQPWLFVYATDEAGRRRLCACLMPKNQAWACRAPLLCFVLSRRRFRANGRENRHAAFDAGAAWMALALQARRLGLFAHAMAGFRLEEACRTLGVSPEEWHVLAAVAVGRRGDSSLLPEDLQAIEAPNARKPHVEVAVPLDLWTSQTDREGSAAAT